MDRQDLNSFILKKERHSNIELFRIILMVFLVASHYVHNSGILDEIYGQSLQSKAVIISTFGMWGKPVINCFIFITGYFMCRSKVDYVKWICFVLQVLFYNLLIYFVFVAFGVTSFSINGFISNIIPVKSVWTDFVSCYLIFYLLIPFINILIKNMDRKLHFRLVCLLGIVYVVLGTVPKFVVTMNYLSWFTFTYSFAAYFRIYKETLMRNRKIWIILFCASYCLSVVSVITGLYVSGKTEMRLTYYLLEDSNKILAVMLSFSFFALFLNIRIKQSKFINTIAKTTFGVLLIHANSDLMRQWLWKDILKCTSYYNTRYYFIHAVISVICVYLVCVVIEMLRLRFIDVPINKLVTKRWRLKE